MIIKGDIFEVQSGKSRPAELSIKDGDIYTTYLDGDFNEQLCCPQTDIKIDPPLGNIRRKITLPDGRVFETDDREAVDKIQPSSFWRHVFKTERNWRLIAPLAVITPILAFSLFRLTIPVFITVGMAMTPDEALYSIDKNIMRLMDRFATEDTRLSTTHQAKIRAQFDGLLANIEQVDFDASDRDFKYNLQFRSAPGIGPNAFALPGGTVVVTDELVEQFPQDHIILAILAHEIGHVENQHSLRQIYRVVGTATTFNMIAGDAGPLIEGVMEEGAGILALSYSRAHENESDNFSYDLLKASNQPVHGLIDFFENFDVPAQEIETDEADNWTSTHPLSQNRVKNIKDRMAEDGIERP